MTHYRWATWGDINAFFGLMLDNVTVMLILTVTLTTGMSADASFTPEFVITRMIPGSAMGVLVGDLIYTYIAFRLAKIAGRTDVTAMPLGLDTPSTFAVAFLVLLPSLREARQDLGMDHQSAMTYAWHVGVVDLVLVGVFKLLFAPAGNKIRRWVPRAGLLGSLAAIALTLIAFLPLVNDVANVPLVGLLSLVVILITLVARRRFPGNIPGALAAVLVGTLAYYGFQRLGPCLGWHLVPPHPLPLPATFKFPALVPTVDWAVVWKPALAKLPIILPFALATIVGGIDCTESAAAAGDEFDTRTILLTEGFASLVAGLLGGVLQNTPYIGQPAYKAMGGRAAYTLATGLFVGAAGYLGWFTHFFDWLPQAAMFPILIFVGLEITAQSFHATPTRHYPALAFAILPALAATAMILVDQILGDRAPSPQTATLVQTLRCLNNGFIISSLLWGAALATFLDNQWMRSACYLAVAGLCSLFGIIHSPLREAPIAWPEQVIQRLPNPGSDPCYQTPYHWAAAYGLASLIVLAVGLFSNGAANAIAPVSGQE